MSLSSSMKIKKAIDLEILTVVIRLKLIFLGQPVMYLAKNLSKFFRAKYASLLNPIKEIDCNNPFF